MPMYCFVTPDGKIVEEIFPVDMVPESITVDLQDGTTVTAVRDRATEFAGQRLKPGSGWPMTCFASGVHPSQAQQLRDYFEKKGVPTEVDNNGDVVYRDASHRKAALKCRGFRDSSM